jgi:hypothetical protein
MLQNLVLAFWQADAPGRTEENPTQPEKGKTHKMGCIFGQCSQGSITKLSNV